MQNINMKKKFIMSLILLIIISIVNSYYGKYYLDSYSNYFIKEIIWFSLGFVIFYLLSIININFILDNSLYVYSVGILLLVVTLLFGVNVNGSRSWIKIFGISFQASEFMKIGLILYLRYITINYDLNDFKYVLVCLIITLIPSVLVFLEPDTGSIISYIVILITFLFLKKLNKWYYIFGVSITLVIIISFIYLYSFNNDLFINLFGTNFFYRMDRITNFINREGYQIETAIKSISLSSFFGIKKRVYFPEAVTDFAITLLIANFGLVGFIIYMIIFLIFIINLGKISKDKYIVKPCVNFIVIQSIINILMNIGLFPIIGITYPLLSYGGSSSLSIIILLSIIYNMGNKDYSYSHHNNYNHMKV